MEAASNYFQPFQDAGRWRCGRRRRQCSCGHRYVPGERELTACPERGRDRRCRRAPAIGSACRACKVHGGRALAGQACPAYRHGRWSRYLPGHLARRFEDAEQDPTLLSLRADIALCRVLMGELLARIDDGSEAERNKTWREILKLITRISSLATKESRRLARARMYLTLDEARLIVVAMAGAVRREVSDQQILSRINHQFHAILSTHHNGSTIINGEANDATT